VIINLIVLALIIGLLLGFNAASLLPVFAIKLLIGLKFFRSGSLGYEKYEHIDSQNRISTRSRYFFRDQNNFKSTCTAKVNLILIGIFVFVLEALSLLLYFVVS